MDQKPTYKELENRIKELEEERQHFAQSLMKSESTLVSIFKAAPTGIGVVCNRLISEANDRLCHMIGYSRDELIGQSARMLYPTDEDFEYVGAEKYRQISLKGTGTVETHWRHKNGDIMDVLLSSTPLDRQDLSVGVTFTALDITHRKLVESQLRRSEQRFRELAELLPQTVFEITPSGQLTFVNKNAFRVFGYTSEDLQKRLNVFELIVAQDQDKIRNRIDSLVSGRKADAGHRYTARRKDGSTFPVLVYCSVSSDQDGAAGLRGIIIDMTQQEELTRERDKLREHYSQAQKMEAIGLLAGGVAHDLNNMLSPILGYGELLLKSLAKDDPIRTSIEEIYSAGLRAKNMVSQLLAFGRKQTFNFRSVNLNQILTGFENLLHRMLRENIRRKWELATDLSEIMADTGQIEQVVMNLALNAQDAMPNGGCLTIMTDMVEMTQTHAALNKSIEPGPYVMLVFSDTGHGMNAQTRQRLFEPFFTTKAKGKGTGLGLATVYGIVKQHKGHIWVYSELEKGTVFKIYFPVAGEGAHMPVTPTAYVEQVAGTETIMIVEDDEAVRKLTQSLLRQHGYSVLSAASGEQCLQVLSAAMAPIDLLLTDVVLPDTNGKELFNQARIRQPGLKVVYMSGYNDNVITHHGMLEEGVSFLQKPFSVNQLAAKVRAVLNS